MDVDVKTLERIFPRYRPKEDGDMIQFGPNCLISVDKVRQIADGGGIVTMQFSRWIEDLRDFWEAQ